MLLAGRNYGSIMQSFPKISVGGIVIFMFRIFSNSNLHPFSVILHEGRVTSELARKLFIIVTIRDHVKLNTYSTFPGKLKQNP